MRGVQGAADRAVALAREHLLSQAPDSRIHDVSHFYVRLALKKFNMNADQDIRVISTGGQADRTLALKNGRVSATILNPAYAMSLEKDGFKTILDIETLNFPVVAPLGTAVWIAVSEETVKVALAPLKATAVVPIRL